MWNGKIVSVIFPTFNEERNIGKSIQDFFATGIVDEILVINNNSTDQTVEEVKKTKAIVINEPIQGYGAALTRGLREASGDCVILAEPDGTFLGRDIFKLLTYSDDFDLVCGTRTTKEMIWQEANMSWPLRSGNWVVAKVLEFLFNTPSLSDCGCTLRLIKREALQKLLSSFTVKGSHFLPEMVILSRLNNLRIVEIPVNYKVRVGLSKITGSWKGILRTGLNMVGLIVRYRLGWIKPIVRQN